MRVYIFRHGATSWTKTCQHTGLTDLELSLKGDSEAKSLGESLKGVKFDHVFSSPLKRAQKTCVLAGFEKEMKLDPDLVEWNYGDYEGLTTEEIRDKVPGWTIFSGDPPNGETSLEIQKRADRFIAKIKSLSGDIAVFSSGHISRVIAARWLNLPVFFGSYLSLSTCSKSVLGFEREYPVILQWNGTSHLNRLE
jgi:broad specificity phosphatase PhoE